MADAGGSGEESGEEGDVLVMKVLAALGLFGIIAGAGHAQHMNAPDAPCQNAGSNADETSCFIRTTQAEDKQLNHVYSVALSVTDGRETERLREAERLWVRFRDANCSAEHELYLGGSAAPAVQFACIEAMTRHRIAELKTMYGWRVEKPEKTF